MGRFSQTIQRVKASLLSVPAHRLCCEVASKMVPPPLPQRLLHWQRCPHRLCQRQGCPRQQCLTVVAAKKHCHRPAGVGRETTERLGVGAELPHSFTSQHSRPHPALPSARQAQWRHSQHGPPAAPCLLLPPAPGDTPQGDIEQALPKNNNNPRALINCCCCARLKSHNLCPVVVPLPQTSAIQFKP